MTKRLYCLRNVHLFEGVSDDQLMQASKCMDTWNNKAQTVYTPSDVHQRVFMLKQGEVELVSEGGERRVTIDTLLPGDMFGDFGFGGQIQHSAIATRRSLICEFKTDEFLKTVRTIPDIAFNLLRSLAERNIDYEEKIVSLQQPAKIHLLNELKSLQSKYNHSSYAQRFKLPLRLSHQALADKTGLNRVTVTKLLGELKKQGLVQIDEKTGAFEVQ